jgi:hypothetical protein
MQYDFTIGHREHAPPLGHIGTSCPKRAAAACGQGVIEYAGALVIATVIVAAVVAVSPGDTAKLFYETIQSRVHDILVNKLPT